MRCKITRAIYDQTWGHWIANMSQKGGEKYQQAFYVFEELAQALSTSSVTSLVSQAVAELHLGRTEEAAAALDQAMKKEPDFAAAIANMLVLKVITGKDPKELTRYVYVALSRTEREESNIGLMDSADNIYVQCPAEG